MGLLLRPDAYIAETGEGVHALTHLGPVTLAGASIQLWLQRLAPYLDGRHSLDDLTGGLPAERQKAVRDVVAILIERGLVRDVAAGETGRASPARVTTAPDPNLAFAGYFHDDAAEVLRRYRGRTAVVIGSGPLADALVAAVRRTGLTRVRTAAGLHLPEPCTAGGGAGPGASEAGALLDGADVVLAVVDAADDGLVRELERHRAGASLVLSAMVGDHVWLTHSGRGDWVSAWLRWRGRPSEVGTTRPGREAAPANGAPSGESRAVPRGNGTPSPESAAVSSRNGVSSGNVPVSPWKGWGSPGSGVPQSGNGAAPGDDAAPAAETDRTWAVVAANHAAYGAFRTLTNTAAPRPGRLVRIDRASLRTETLPFLPHPFAEPAAPPTAEEFRERVRDLAARGPLDPADFSRRAVALTGAGLGVIGPPDERDHVQIPLSVCEIAVSRPAGLPDGEGPAPYAIGAGLGFATARRRAALRAIARYAVLMPDPRRVRGPGGRPLAPASAGADDAPAALGALRRGATAGSVLGYDPCAGEVRAVDVRRVFPALDGRDAGGRAVPAGVAAALGWAEAVRAGLLDHCRGLAIGHLRGAARPVDRLAPESARLGAPGDRYLAMAKAIGEPLALYDIGGPVGVPAVLCTLGPEASGAAAGASMTDAVTGALEEALLRYQSVTAGQPGYRPSGVPDLPGPLRGDLMRPVRDDAPLDVTAIARALTGHGHRPTVVPLDHDPAVAGVLPFVVHVVVSRDRAR